MVGRLVTLRKRADRRQRGQSLLLFAICLPAIVVLILVVADTAVTTSRLMDGLAVADFAAHAGAQEVRVLPNGRMEPSSRASEVVAWYFYQQAPPYVQLVSVWCGVRRDMPACEVTVRVQTAGFLLGGDSITVRTVGYLSYGVTRVDQ